MKRFLLLVATTLVLIFLSGFYVWVLYHDNVSAIPYLQNKDWAAPVTIPTMNSLIYDSAVGEEGTLYTVWARRNPEKGVIDICFTAMNPQGELVIGPRALLSHANVLAVDILLRQDRFTLSWIKQEEPYVTELVQCDFTLEGAQQGTERPLTRTTDKVSDLDVVAAPGGGGILIWTEQSGDLRQIRTARLDPFGRIGEVNQISGGEDSLSTPRLAIDSRGQYHLVWFRNLSDDNRDLYYGTLDRDGRPEGEPMGWIRANSGQP